VNKKIKAALGEGLTPIVCCGEKLAEREAGKTQEVVQDHIEGAFKGFSTEEVQKCVIAYEPVWAIGTGKVAAPEQAQEVHSFIRGLLKKLYSDGLAEEISILYGGSVKPENSQELMKQKDVDGALVGGASLDAKSFAAIVLSANKAEV
jgi:triosephosphate isomerase (TIM)